MRIRLIILWLSILIGTTLHAQKDQFEQALTAFNQGQYQESINLLEDISTGEDHSVELYYNLGLSHLKLNNLSEGIANLHRALALSPNHADARSALNIAKGKISTPITEIPDFIIYQSYTDIAQSLSINSWVLIQIIGLLGLILLIYWLLFRTSSKRPILYVAIVVMVLLSIWSYTNASYLREMAINPNLAVIGQEQTDIFIGADNRSEIIAVVGEGVTARIIDEIADWIKIELADKDLGWVQKNKVIII